MQIEQKNYWGPWATLGFGILIFIVFGIIQSGVIIAYGLYQKGWDTSAGLEAILKPIMLNGDAIAMAEIPAALIGVLLIVWLSAVRKPLTVKGYLDLSTPKLKDIFKWIGVIVLIIIAMEVLNTVLDRETPEFMTKVYESTTNLPLLLIAVTIAAPFFEEFLFRGFLLEGFRHSWIGTVGAVLFTSAVWAIIHAQYGAFEIATIFLIGIILAIAKLKTGSLYVPIAMHFFMNFMASVFMEVASRYPE